MVFPSGFEPLAYRLGGDRSILLSYGNKLSSTILACLMIRPLTIIPYFELMDNQNDEDMNFYNFSASSA